MRRSLSDANETFGRTSAERSGRGDAPLPRLPGGIASSSAVRGRVDRPVEGKVRGTVGRSAKTIKKI